MSCSIIKKAKIFFIAALVVIVAGLTIFGIFGFNQTIDYKSGYEMQVSVDQKVGKAMQVMKTAADNYLADNGIKAVKYATQSLNDGMTIVYKFNYDVTESISGLKTAVQSAVDTKSGVQGVSVDVVVSQVKGIDITNVGKVLLALGLSVVGILIYTLIVERLAGAVTTLVSTVLSAVLYLALIGLTRIPAASFVAIGGALAMIISASISVATVNKYKKETKRAVKLSNVEIVDKVANNAKFVYVLIGAGVLLTALALCAFIMPYLMFASLQILVAGICGISSAVFAAPVIWSFIKKNKK